MSRKFLVFLLLMLVSGVSAAQTSQRRLVRLEKHIYGWYAVISPEFDRTVGTRQLYKISGGDHFLTGLSGRLVLVEGVFNDGVLQLPALASPPESLDDGTERRVILLDLPQSELALTTEDGYTIRDGSDLLARLRPGRWQLDTLLEPLDGGVDYELERILHSEQLTWSRLQNEAEPDLDRPALLDLTLTQSLLNAITEVGLSQAQLSTIYQGVELNLSRLNIQLPDGSQSVSQPWKLTGSLDLNFAGSTRLAETAFSVAAQPLVEEDVFKLKPDWNSIQIQGQLPFNFVLGSSSLASYTQYLPEKVPLIPLSTVTDTLQREQLVAAESQPHWYLGTPAPGSVRLALGEREKPLPQPTQVAPGSFRLVLGADLVDRLLKRQVGKMLSPEEPYRPEPPLEVGKALFVPILVKEIYVRNLEAGYSNSVFRFNDLAIDVSWEAGPFSGLEPLLETSGYISPKLAAEGSERYWSWDVVLADLKVTSDKLPGDRAKLAAEFKPKIEDSLGPKLARKNRFSNRFPLAKALPGTRGALVLTRLTPLDKSLTLEGHVETE